MKRPSKKEGSYEKRKIFKTYIIYNHRPGSVNLFFALTVIKKGRLVKEPNRPNRKKVDEKKAIISMKRSLSKNNFKKIYVKYLLTSRYGTIYNDLKIKECGYAKTSSKAVWPAGANRRIMDNRIREYQRMPEEIETLFSSLSLGQILWSRSNFFLTST